MPGTEDLRWIQSAANDLNNYLQVITAQMELLSNQRNDLDILRRRMDASVRLVKAIGGAWDASQLPKL